jgi:DNA-binding NarL/FixJ family response regulator
MSQDERKTNQPIRVAIIEDDMYFRTGLQTVLSEYSDRVQVIGEAVCKTEAITLVREQAPQVALLDMRIPENRLPASRPSEEQGIDAIKETSRISPATRILVLSYIDDPTVLFRALQAGAHGYIIKGEPYDGEWLAAAIERVVAGEIFYSPQIAQLIRDFHQKHGNEQNSVVEPLTPREREVLDLLADRKTNAEIAKALTIEISTVRTHVANILAKLHLSSRHEIPGYMRIREFGK